MTDPVITDAPRRVIEQIAGFLEDTAATLRREAQGLIGGQHNRMLAEADDCDRWRAVLVADAPSPSERREEIARVLLADDAEPFPDCHVTDYENGAWALAKADAILSLGPPAPAPAPVSLGADDGLWFDQVRDQPEFVQNAARILDNIERVSRWSDNEFLVTARAHAYVLFSDLPGALSPSPPGAADLKEGFVLVPREPDVNMIAAFWRQKNTGSQEPSETSDATDDYSAYRAMIAAAPSPDQPSEEIEN